MKFRKRFSSSCMDHIDKSAIFKSVMGGTRNRSAGILWVNRTLCSCRNSVNHRIAFPFSHYLCSSPPRRLWRLRRRRNCRHGAALRPQARTDLPRLCRFCTSLPKMLGFTYFTFYSCAPLVPAGHPPSMLPLMAMSAALHS